MVGFSLGFTNALAFNSAWVIFLFFFFFFCCSLLGKQNCLVKSMVYLYLILKILAKLCNKKIKSLWMVFEYFA